MAAGSWSSKLNDHIFTHRQVVNRENYRPSSVVGLDCKLSRSTFSDLFLLARTDLLKVPELLPPKQRHQLAVKCLNT